MKQQTVVGYTDITDADVRTIVGQMKPPDLIRVSLGEPDTTYLRILAGEFMSAEQHHIAIKQLRFPATEIEQAVAEEAKGRSDITPAFQSSFQQGQVYCYQGSEGDKIFAGGILSVSSHHIYTIVLLYELRVCGSQRESDGIGQFPDAALPLLAGFRIEHADRLVGLIQREGIGWYHAVHASLATVQHEPALVVNPVRKGVQSGPFGPGGLFQANAEGQGICLRPRRKMGKSKQENGCKQAKTHDSKVHSCGYLGSCECLFIFTFDRIKKGLKTDA